MGKLCYMELCFDKGDLKIMPIMLLMFFIITTKNKKEAILNYIYFERVSKCEVLCYPVTLGLHKWFFYNNSYH